MSITILLSPRTPGHPRQLIAQGGSEMAKNGTESHISLAVFDDIDIDRLAAVGEPVALRHRGLRLSFPAVSIFADSPSVVYLHPIVTHEILDLHLALFSALGEEGSRSRVYYRPGKWAPHLTAAAPVEIDEAFHLGGLALNDGFCREYEFDRIEIVVTPPWQVAAVFHLNGEPNQTPHGTAGSRSANA